MRAMAAEIDPTDPAQANSADKFVVGEFFRGGVMEVYATSRTSGFRW